MLLLSTTSDIQLSLISVYPPCSCPPFAVFIVQQNEKYVKQKRDVVVNKRLNKELQSKANKILTLVEKGYKKVVFPDIMKIRKIIENTK